MQRSIPLQVAALHPAHISHSDTRLTTLLLGHTDSPATSSSGLGVLATDTESPVVTETTVSTDLLQALQIITELGVDTVGEDLAVFAIDDIALTIEEPGWDLVLGRVLDDGDDPLELFRGEFTSAAYVSTIPQPSPELSIPLVQFDIGLLADQVGVPAADTLYLGESIDDLDFSLNIGVEQSDDLNPFVRYVNVAELRLCSVAMVHRVLTNWKFDFSPLRRTLLAKSSDRVCLDIRDISYLTRDILPAGWEKAKGGNQLSSFS